MKSLINSAGLVAFTASLAASPAITGCGKNAPDTAAAQTPSVVNSLTPEQRAQYCFFSVNRDTDPAQRAFTDSTQGTWVNYPAQPNADYTRREFILSLERKIAATTVYETFSHNVEDITFKKMCVSQPLDESYGIYAGYRVLEFLAANNEGAAAILVKLDASAPSPVLTVSDRIYQRFNTEGLTGLRSSLTGGSIRTFWVYRERR